MALTLDQIPDISVAPPGAARSAALSVRVTPRRRTVLRSIAFSAFAVGGLAASATSRFATPAHAETGPGGLTGWDRNDCRDAYPNGYNEQKDNVGAYTGRAGACFGGSYRGSTYCASGWHRSGTVRDSPATYYYKPVSNACGAGTTKKNAWRWTTPDGVWWRCSDGNTTVSAGGTSNTYFTICRY